MLLVLVSPIVCTIAAPFSSNIRGLIRSYKTLYVLSFLISFMVIASIIAEPFVMNGVLADAKTHKTRAQIQQLHTALLVYAGEYPVPAQTMDNAHWIGILRADNPRHLALLTLPDSDMNSQGEMTDAWKTPLLINMKDPINPIVQSAGPDRKWNTPDDMSTAQGK